MTEEHRQLLEQLERESRAKQETFMNGIARKLQRPRLTTPPAHPFRGAPDFWNEFEWPIEERIERFMENFRAVGGHAERLADMAEAHAFIAGKAEEMGAKRILRQDEPELAALGLETALPDVQIAAWNSLPEENWKARAAEADFGVVMADYAAAYTGSAVVLSDRTKGRSVSLLPTALFLLIPVDRLKTRLGEVMADLDRKGRADLPAGVHFISGPSRSADIENDLTIGVHGPGIVYALLIG